LEKIHETPYDLHEPSFYVHETVIILAILADLEGWVYSRESGELGDGWRRKSRLKIKTGGNVIYM